MESVHGEQMPTYVDVLIGRWCMQCCCDICSICWRPRPCLAVRCSGSGVLTVDCRRCWLLGCCRGRDACCARQREHVPADQAELGQHAGGGDKAGGAGGGRVQLLPRQRGCPPAVPRAAQQLRRRQVHHLHHPARSRSAQFCGCWSLGGVIQNLGVRLTHLHCFACQRKQHARRWPAHLLACCCTRATAGCCRS